ncbi:MAG: DUF1573 domain-containing protein [Alistipes sp.]|nr:DUF1573 domain-containing protein [Alistipes sp.]
MRYSKLFFTALLTLFVCVATPAFAQGKKRGACIEFKESVHDFGQIARKGDNRSHIFKVTNSGDEPLVILSASTSCSCTKVTFSHKPIKPGDTSSVKVVIEPRKIDEGVFHRIVQIHSNASNGTAILTIKGLAK